MHLSSATPFLGKLQWVILFPQTPLLQREMESQRSKLFVKSHPASEARILIQPEDCVTLTPSILLLYQAIPHSLLKPLFLLVFFFFFFFSFPCSIWAFPGQASSPAWSFNLQLWQHQIASPCTIVGSLQTIVFQGKLHSYSIL